jgi:hypothetical protein
LAFSAFPRFRPSPLSAFPFSVFRVSAFDRRARTVAPADRNDALASNNDAPASNIDAPASYNDAPGGDIDAPAS